MLDFLKAPVCSLGMICDCDVLFELEAEVAFALMLDFELSLAVMGLFWFTYWRGLFS